jgi:pimeloyl-ACP methyl ester carboxylesterase
MHRTLVELVRVTTADGVRLDGALHEPRDHAADEGVDALLCVHGTGGSFYSSSLFETLARDFTARGVAVLRVNTRGHDAVSTAVTLSGPRRQGAAYEAVDDCRHDLSAWAGWLAERGYARVGLVGHSLGAVKAIFALANSPHLAVARLVALSPPRLSHSLFRSGPRAAVFCTTYEAAVEHIERGAGDTLMHVSFPLPMIITAAGYVEKYGPDERYDFLKHLPAVACPALVTFGAAELAEHIAFRDSPAAVEELAARNPRLAIAVIPDADHFYVNQHQALARQVREWLAAAD